MFMAVYSAFTTKAKKLAKAKAVKAAATAKVKAKAKVKAIILTLISVDGGRGITPH